MQPRTTLLRFLSDEARRRPGAAGLAELAPIVGDVASGVKAIAAALGAGSLWGVLGDAGTENGQGERQRTLDVLANATLLRACEWGGRVAAIASEELDAPHLVPPEHLQGDHLLVFDPLDGSSNVDVNVSVGTIFSVLRRTASGVPTVEEFLRRGVDQVAAGYAIYGPSTMLVLTVGRGTHGFTLDREVGEFVLTHPDLRIPEETREFAVNASNERHWDPPVKRYVRECLEGGTGPRGADFNMRWIASLVAEVHRILVRGGVFMYPRDARPAARSGRLRLLYEASPMAMLVEQAGGAASTGSERVLEVVPASLHEKVPLVLGSRREVERIARYHAEHERGEGPFSDPLFGERSLFQAG
jgi:fructose-1,6-bisphosphatase I/sedoheptulose-1,7-bisphosphatase/fructose-1,6-bisphosphatase I